ncbi:MAG: MBL fold metallo-hydrolase [Bacteroidia bacterium]|nr:MBL fold metallo-hydrolase [Bacteroidia bacterium]
MRISKIFIFFAFGIISCTSQEVSDNQGDRRNTPLEGINLEILGIAQDAGFPQANCEKSCCAAVWKKPDLEQKVVSLGLLDSHKGKRFIFEATPDFSRQLQISKERLPNSELSGVFLTHAHIGHYTGLMYLGHEVMGAKGVPVFVMPRMKEYLSNHGPWDQLVRYENIDLQEMKADSLMAISDSLFVKPLLVPHRDEYSETVGYMIYGPSKKAFFVPDINKWSIWETDIKDIIREVDYAFVDATFYDDSELPGRNIKDIPHPFIIESMEIFKDLSPEEKSRVYFIHFNHTNPVMQVGTEASKAVEAAGFNIAREGLRFRL